MISTSGKTIRQYDNYNKDISVVSILYFQRNIIIKVYRGNNDTIPVVNK